MPERVIASLDSPAFRARFRQPDHPQSFANVAVNRRPVRQLSGMNDVRVASPPKIMEPAPPPAQPILPQLPQPVPPVQLVQPQPFARPAQPRQRSSKVLQRRAVYFPGQRRSNNEPAKSKRRHTKLQLTLGGMAAVVFVFGVMASLQTIKVNHNAAAQVAALARKTNNTAAGSAAVPSTIPPTLAAVAQYTVAPNLPRYLRIPKLGVDARVMQVGVTASGALGTPSNVFDTAWYTGSAEPGQPGVTLIDGHVSSWTTQGVFYGLKTLVPGDTIEIERGDSSVYIYQVVKTQIYNANDVNMKAAMTPIVPGTPGLNLITCAGDVIKGTSNFNERIIVFTKQIEP